jgi:hypothetical protein
MDFKFPRIDMRMQRYGISVSRLKPTDPKRFAYLRTGPIAWSFVLWNIHIMCFRLGNKNNNEDDD